MAKTIIFPVGGIDRQFAFQSQPPYTTVAASNVRSAGASSGRVRGGSRPGLVRAYTDQLGSDPITGTIDSATYDEEADVTRIIATTPIFAAWMVGMSLTCTDPAPDHTYTISAYVDETTVDVSGDASAETGGLSIAFGAEVNLLASVRPAQGATGATFLDDFETVASGYQIYPNWSVPTGGTQLPYVTEVGGKRYATANGTAILGHIACDAAYTALPLDTSAPYTITMRIEPNNSTFQNSRYVILARMDDATPSLADCLYVELVLLGSTTTSYAVYLTRYSGGVAGAVYTYYGVLAAVAPFDFKVVISGNDVTVYIDGGIALSKTMGAAAGTRLGFHLERQSAAQFQLVAHYRVDYQRTSQSLDYSRSYLCAGAGGSLYVENDAGGMAAVAGDVDLVADKIIDAVEMAGKLYIADYDTPRLSETGCTIDVDGTGGVAAPGKVIDKAGIVWDSLGIDTDNDLCVISSSTGSPTAVAAGAYKIASVAAGYITLSDVADVEDSSLVVKVERAPKIYDPVAGTLSIWSQTISGGVPKGVMPTGCPLIALYGGRIVLGGASDYPHLWYACRATDPLDWDYAARDDMGAVAASVARYRQIGKPLTALIAYADDHMVFGCEGEIWVAHGNLRNGVMLNKSRTVGILGQRAWCLTPGNELVFLADGGLYAMRPQDNGAPVPLSESRLPRELRDIDPTTILPQLAWDNEHKSVRIWLTPITQGKIVRSTAEHWCFDWTQKAFWQDTYYGAHEPWSFHTFRVPSIGRSVLLVGGRDGLIRRYSTDVGADDGAPLQASVLLGPFRLGDDTYEAMIRDLTAILGTSSGDVTWNLYLGDSAEEAYDRYVAGTVDETGTWSSGRNLIDRLRRTAAAAYLQVTGSSTSTRSWEMDSILMGVEAWGRVR